MSESARQLMLGILAWLVVFVAAAWELPRRWLATPLDLLPALLVCAALGRKPGGWRTVALVGGLARDAWSQNPLGASLLPLYVTGWFLHAHRDLLEREKGFAQALLGAAASAVVPGLTLGVVLALGRAPTWGAWLPGQWLVLTATGGLLTPLMFRLLRRLDRWFAHPTVETTSFRQDRDILRGKY